jgi:hypothetical protein
MIAPSVSHGAAITALPGWNLIANQAANNNQVGTILPAVPAGTLLLKYNNSLGIFETLNVFSAAWANPQQTLEPGDGAWLFSPAPGALVLAVPGPVNVLILPVPFASCAECFLVSRQTDVAGTFTTIMGVAPQDGAVVYRFNAAIQAFQVASFDSAVGGWDPAEITAPVGEALWICPKGGPFPSVPTACNYTKAIPPGWSMLANQCVNAKTIASLIPSAPSGTLLLKYNNLSSAFETVNAFTTCWSLPGQMLAPGEGTWIFNPGLAFDVHIAGFAGSGGPVGLTGPGCYLVSRKSADAGNYLNIIGSPPADGATVYRFDPVTDSFEIATYDSGLGGWVPAEITAAVGEPLWICPQGGPAPTVPSLCNYTKSIPPGWSLFANQCANANTVSSLLPCPPIGTLLLKYNNTGGSFESLNGFSGCWANPSQTLAPGEGAWIFNPTAVLFTALSVGFAGPGGTLGFSGPGCYLASRQIADTGNYVNIMGSPPADGAVVYKFNPVTDTFEIASYDSALGGWDPAELTAGLGEALWICPKGGPAPAVPSLCNNTKTIPPGWSLIANQCSNDNKVSSLMPCVPAGTTLVKFNNATGKFENRNRYSGTAWKDPSQTLAPGEGAFLQNPTASAFDILIAGTAGPGGLNSFSTPGCYLVSRKSAAAGNYSTIIGGTPPSGTTMFRFETATQSYQAALFDSDLGGWDPAELTAGVNESVWICLGGGPAPAPPCYVDVEANFVCNLITISWPCPGCHLESTTALATPPSASAWSVVPGASPVTLPMTGASMFFQVVCP